MTACCCVGGCLTQDRIDSARELLAMDHFANGRREFGLRAALLMDEFFWVGSIYRAYQIVQILEAEVGSLLHMPALAEVAA